MNKHLVGEQVRLLYEGSQTKRFHTRAMVTSQNIAEHSHGVAMLAWILSGGKASPSLLMAALTHDMAEFVLGDMPAPAKRALGLRERFAVEEAAYLSAVDMSFESVLGPTEERILGMADAAEGMLRCVLERRLGNRTMGGVFNSFCDYFAQQIPNEREALVYDAIYAMWEAV